MRYAHVVKVSINNEDHSPPNPLFVIVDVFPFIALSDEKIASEERG